jgi:hypothetical protein
MSTPHTCPRCSLAASNEARFCAACGEALPALPPSVLAGAGLAPSPMERRAGTVASLLFGVSAALLCAVVGGYLYLTAPVAPAPTPSAAIRTEP